jgi:hypothetical protein
MIRVLLTFILTGVFIPGFTQDFRKYYAVVFDANLPLVNKEFIDNISTRGARFIYRESINNKFSAGAEIGFATYNDHLPPQAYVNGNTTVFAELFTYVYNYTLTLSGEYYFTEEKWIKPFAGLGLGACYNRYAFFYNVFADEDRVWGALFRPNVGTLMRFGKNARLAARISVHFDYSTTKSTDFDYTSFVNLGADAGITWIIR